MLHFCTLWKHQKTLTRAVKQSWPIQVSITVIDVKWQIRFFVKFVAVVLKVLIKDWIFSLWGKTLFNILYVYHAVFVNETSNDV